MSNIDKNEIKTTVAMFSNFLPQQTGIHKSAVIYFWESHTKNPKDKENIQATSNLLNRADLLDYENMKYVRDILAVGITCLKILIKCLPRR
jgi:hypothetical protein